MRNFRIAWTTCKKLVSELRNSAVLRLRKRCCATWPINCRFEKLNNEAGSSFSVADGLAIAFSAVHPSGHAGVVFCDALGIPRLLHYCGGPDAKIEKISGNLEYVWATPKLLEEQVLQMTALCDLAASSNLSLSYRFRFSEQAKFHDRAGQLYFIPTAECPGLTCATFIMLLFLQCGVKLLDIERWRNSDEDTEFMHRFIRDQIAPRYPHLVQVFSQDLGAKRFRPDDVIASALFEHIPTSFRNTRLAGPVIREYAYKHYDSFGIAATRI